MPLLDEYKQFGMHPRYGQGPRITGLKPETDFGENIFLHWRTPKERCIPCTAMSRLRSRIYLFRREKKYWFDKLGYALESECVRCVCCRKKQQGLDQKRECYEELFPISTRTLEKNND